MVSDDKDVDQVGFDEAIDNGVWKAVQQVPPLCNTPNGPTLGRLQDRGQAGTEFVAEFPAERRAP